jgi:hypothetical protein
VDSCTAIVEHHDGRLELVRAWQPVIAATTCSVAVSPAPIFDDIPHPGIACGGETARL